MGASPCEFDSHLPHQNRPRNIPEADFSLFLLNPLFPSLRFPHFSKPLQFLCCSTSRPCGALRFMLSSASLCPAPHVALPHGKWSWARNSFLSLRVSRGGGACPFYRFLSKVLHQISASDSWKKAEIFCKPRPPDHALRIAAGTIPAAIWPFKRGIFRRNMPCRCLGTGSVRPWFVESQQHVRNAPTCSGPWSAGSID